MKKINWSSVIFAIVILLILIIIFKTLVFLGKIILIIAIAGFIIMGIAPLFHKFKK